MTSLWQPHGIFMTSPWHPHGIPAHPRTPSHTLAFPSHSLALPHTRPRLPTPAHAPYIVRAPPSFVRMPPRPRCRYTPADPGKSGLSAPCPNCGAGCKEWDAHCGECGTHFPACVVSGKAILEPHLASQCRACKHRYYESELLDRGLRNCALCHTPLPLAGGGSPGELETRGYRQ